MKQLILLSFAMNLFNSIAQNEQTLINGDWYIANFTINDNDLLKSDTLLIHRTEWTDKKGDHIDSLFDSNKLWCISFDDFGGLGIGWTDYQSAARGSDPPYHHEMYPCQNMVWRLNKKTITFFINGTSYVFKVSSNKDHENEYILIKHH